MTYVAHVTGSFEVKIELNGDTAISFSTERITYKGVDVLWDDVTVRGSASNETNLSFAVFVPDQTSERAEGMVGLTETFNITFHQSGSSFNGTFQRTNEGGLQCSGKRTESPEQFASRLPKLQRELSEVSAAFLHVPLQLPPALFFE